MQKYATIKVNFKKWKELTSSGVCRAWQWLAKCAANLKLRSSSEWRGHPSSSWFTPGRYPLFATLVSCGSDVDSLGTHGLSCRKNSARIQRHNALNDIIHRALGRAGLPAIKEPPGLLRSDGKRPDEATQIPWASGRCLVWTSLL